MFLSEFVLTHTKGKSPLDLVYFASVSVAIESGALWWKTKSVDRKTISRNYAGSWFFVDSGKYTPGFQAEELERAYHARKDLEPYNVANNRIVAGREADCCNSG